MNTSAKHDLSHISFAGTGPARPQRSGAHAAHAASAAATPVSEEPLDEFISWVLGRAGLEAAAYRVQPLQRRLPACLRVLKVDSTHAARELLERRPPLIATVVNSLLIGVTEFFRGPDVFASLRGQVLPALADRPGRLRIWSAACSTGAELYSMAILLAEEGLLKRSFLLGTDCRGGAIQRAKAALYDAPALKHVPSATRDAYFVSVAKSSGRVRACTHAQRSDRKTACVQARTLPSVDCINYFEPAEALRRHVHWKVADLLAGVEDGPWDIILWRNAAIYLKSQPAEAIWRRLASVLAPGGVLIAGRAERPPHDLQLTQMGRGVYHVGSHPARVRGDGKHPILVRSIGGQAGPARSV